MFVVSHDNYYPYFERIRIAKLWIANLKRWVNSMINPNNYKYLSSYLNKLENIIFHKCKYLHLKAFQ